MKPTGFKGTGHVFGRERTFNFDEGKLSIDPVSLSEAQMLVNILEKIPALPTGAQSRAPAPTTPAPETSAPSSDEAPATTEPTAAEKKATAAAEKKAKAAAEKEAKAAKAKADKEAKAKAAKKKKAEAAAAKAKAAAEAAAKAAEEAAAEAEDDEDEEPPHDPETGEVLDADDEDNYAEEERAAIQEESAAAEAAAGSNGAAPATGAVPDEIKKAKHLRSVIVHLFEQGVTAPDDIVAWCKAHEDEIAVVKRVGAKLPDRVGRAIAIMSN